MTVNLLLPSQQRQQQLRALLRRHAVAVIKRRRYRALALFAIVVITLAVALPVMLVRKRDHERAVEEDKRVCVVPHSLFPISHPPHPRPPSPSALF